MEAIIQPVSDWWRAFSLLTSDFFGTMGPAQYAKILVITGIIGFLWLRSGSPK